MDTKSYINQWREVKKMSKGKTMNELRSIFKDSIKKDFMGYNEPLGYEFVFIDVSFKNILVTFIEENSNGAPRLSNFFNIYDESGKFTQRRCIPRKYQNHSKERRII